MPHPNQIIPNRVFLDTCTVQALVDCGNFIFGEDQLPRLEDHHPKNCPQVLKRPDSVEVLSCLKSIFLFNQRAHFEWIVSEKSLMEADARRYQNQSRYIREIMDHSSICLSENPPTDDAFKMAEFFSGPRFGFFSANDKKLLTDAIASGCDTFLTIEKRLPKMSNNVLSKMPFFIATPYSLWEQLRPHLAGL